MLSKGSVVVAIFLLLCLFDMPYGYYQFVRLITTVFFVFMAIDENKNQNSTLVFIAIGIAVLFQPIFKVPLGRVLWNIVDVIVAIGLGVYFIKNRKV